MEVGRGGIAVVGAVCSRDFHDSVQLTFLSAEKVRIFVAIENRGLKAQHAGNRDLDRESHNVAQTFRFAFIWYEANFIIPYMVVRLAVFLIVRQSVEVTPTENRSYKQLLQGSRSLETAPTGNRSYKQLLQGSRRWKMFLRRMRL